MRLIVLKDLSIVVDDIGIVSKILMILYIAEYKSRFVARRVSRCMENILTEQFQDIHY
jgi:hypothetical protein